MLPPRQEGGRLAGDAEEEGLEEGEARPDEEDLFDPDVALSCIVSHLPSLGSPKCFGRSSGCRVVLVRAGLLWCWV
jgi:hypothetical protein